MLKISGIRLSTLLLAMIVLLQGAFSLFYIVDLAMELFGIRQTAMSWEYHETVQIVTIFGMLLGAVLGVVVLKNLSDNVREVDNRMLVASGQFHELMTRRFEEWALSPSEKDVAILTLKGLSNAEIAEVRGKSVGTIKAQCNAIYQKAGVSGRTQLISFFIEDLL
ncbi:MAG: LuxR C-terminal-related transcriptional regulator [Paracoccaceae bacterium]